MTDLLLIHPGGSKETYQDLSDEFTAIEPPLWVRLIAGYCLDRGYTVKIIDAEADNLSPKRVGDRVAEINPTLTVIVAYGHQPSAAAQSMDAVNAICKAIDTNSIMIVGGNAAALPEQTLLESGVDFVCTGEGPATVVGLLSAAANGHVFLTDVPGLMCISDGKVTRTAAAPRIDVNELHGNVWHLLPMEKYRSHNWQTFGQDSRQPYASIYTTLGCPYACSFCCINAPFGGPGYRMRKPEDVIAEVDMLHNEYGVNTIKIIDEMFVLNPRHVREICEGLAAKPYADKLNFWAYARVDTVKTPKQLELLRAAGVRWLCLGIESGSEMVRDGAEKSLDGDDIVRIVRMIQDAGIYVLGNYIFGLPDDTIATMTETLDLAKDLNCEFANFYSGMAYPGAALHKLAKELPETWSGYSQHSYECHPMPTNTLSAAEVLRFRDDAFHDYFTGTSYLNMVADKFGFETANHIGEMADIRLPRKLLTRQGNIWDE